MPKSRFFRVAVEGATTDGRQIERNWLTEMAAAYNRTTYAARINMEHIRGITADPPFQSLGDVVSLKTEEIMLDIGGKQEKRLALFAEIDALDQLVAINRKGQKLYTSIEVNPDFAGTGKAYLVGLAVTDSPASLGTEMLEFCGKQGANSPLAARKQDPGNLFTAATETVIELIGEGKADADPTGLFASMKKFFDGLGGPAAVAPAQAAPAVAVTGTEAKPATPAAAPDGNFAQVAALLGQVTATLQTFVAQSADAQAKADTRFAAIEAKLESTPATGFVQRPVGTGGNADVIQAEF